MITCPRFVTASVMVHKFPPCRGQTELQRAEAELFEVLQHDQFVRPLTQFDRTHYYVQGAPNCTVCLVSRTPSGEHTRTYGIVEHDEDSVWDDAP